MNCDYRLHSIVEKVSKLSTEKFTVKDIPYYSCRNQHISTFLSHRRKSVLKLADILHIPLSKQHHHLLFNELLKMGFSPAVLKYCDAISRIDFERYLSGYPEVGLAYVELFNEINEYRLGKDHVEGLLYMVLVGLNFEELVLILIIQHHEKCIP
jgi:hypothetical protein